MYKLHHLLACQAKICVLVLPLSSAFNFQINSAQSDAVLQDVLMRDSSMTCLVEAGYLKALTSVSVNEKNDIVTTITTFYLFVKVKAAMDQFQQGLESAGILQYMKKYTDLIRPMFVDEALPFTAGKYYEFFSLPENQF